MSAVFSRKDDISSYSCGCSYTIAEDEILHKDRYADTSSIWLSTCKCTAVQLTYGSICKKCLDKQDKDQWDYYKYSNKNQEYLEAFLTECKCYRFYE